MIYNTFKILFRLVIEAYFRSISLRNVEKIPKKAPVIFTANHPSAFMDPIVITVLLKRPLHYLARGESFRNPLTSLFFRKIHMIPIYRSQETPNEMHKNEEIFQKCYEYLKEGKAIMIFPEGVSKTERRIGHLKTGAARIALGAEKAYDFKLGVKIISVGINYTNPHEFQSDLFLNFSNPISVNKLKEEYEKDEKETVHKLTELMQKELEERIVIIQNEELDEIVENIEKIYRVELRESQNKTSINQDNFRLSKDIVDGVNYFQTHDPKQLAYVKGLIDQYLNVLDRFNIKDAQLRTSYSRAKDLLLWIPYLIIFFPLFLYGAISNYIPYRLTGILSSRRVERKEFEGSVLITFGLFLFSGIYIVETVLVGIATNWWITLVYALLLYPTGLFALSYAKKFRKVRRVIRLLILYLRKNKLINDLTNDRNEIIELLNQAKEEFLIFRNNKESK